MLLYYATRISENISKREPEGYLICKGVPIARTGSQVYLAQELNLDGDPNKEIPVYRPEEEVFSKATIASFEGMPVTDDHPEDGVDVDNISYLQKGHAQNIRRGTGDEQNMLIADLIITDQTVIDEIMNDGKREISCGYEYELSEEDGKYYQRQIRGNHVAIVDRGRAGHRVCIKDSAPIIERSAKHMNNKVKRVLSKMFVKYAIDAEPEDIEEAVDVMQTITEEPVGESELADPAPKSATESTQDEDPKYQEIMDRLNALEGKLNDAMEGVPAEEIPPKQPEQMDEDPEEDPLAKLEEDLDEVGKEEPIEEEDEEEEQESHFVDPEAMEEEDEDVDEVIAANNEEEKPMLDKRACDAAREALRVCKPFIAALPPAQRKRASDALAKSLRKTAGMDAKATKNGYVAIKKAQRKAAADKAVDREVRDLGAKIMQSRNVNYKK